jgi:hypothetical protein
MICACASSAEIEKHSSYCFLAATSAYAIPALCILSWCAHSARNRLSTKCLCSPSSGPLLGASADINAPPPSYLIHICNIYFSTVCLAS